MGRLPAARGRAQSSLPSTGPSTPAPPFDPPRLRIADVADVLGWSERGVRNLVRDGRLKAYRLGRHLRFREADVLALYTEVQ